MRREQVLEQVEVGGRQQRQHRLVPMGRVGDELGDGGAQLIGVAVKQRDVDQGVVGAREVQGPDAHRVISQRFTRSHAYRASDLANGCPGWLARSSAATRYAHFQRAR